MIPSDWGLSVVPVLPIPHLGKRFFPGETAILGQGFLTGNRAKLWATFPAALEGIDSEIHSLTIRAMNRRSFLLSASAALLGTQLSASHHQRRRDSSSQDGGDCGGDFGVGQWGIDGYGAALFKDTPFCVALNEKPWL